METEGDFRAYFSKFNYQIEFCVSLLTDWPSYYSKFSYIPIFYENFQFVYNAKYLNKNENWIECSFVLMSGKEVVAIVPLILKQQIANLDGIIHAFRAPLFVDCISEKFLKKTLNVLDNFYDYCVEQGFLERDFQLKFDFLGNQPNRKAFEYFRRKFVYCSVVMDHVVNAEGLKTLEHGFIRKSYKSLINKKNNEVTIKVFSQLEPYEWEQFKQLHEIVSGRITRNFETWNVQYEEVNNRSSFCVGCFLNEILVGWALVQVGISQAIYAVGVYDRNYRNINVSHKIQKRILEHLRQINVDEYILGESYDVLPNDREFSEKMAQIDMFKRGFSNDAKLKVILREKRV